MKVRDCDHTHVHVRHVSLVGLPAAGYGPKMVSSWSEVVMVQAWSTWGSCLRGEALVEEV